MSTSNASGSNFSKIIKELKSKHPGANKGRGGPNFVNKRGTSAGQQKAEPVLGLDDLHETVLGVQVGVAGEAVDPQEGASDVQLSEDHAGV